MKRQFLSLMLLMLGTLFCHAQYSVLNGDLNHDGKITVEDMTLMANIILQKDDAETIESACELSYGVVSELAETAELLSGQEFNTAIKQLVDPFAKFSTWDETIKKITFRKGSSSEGTLISSKKSQGEARAIYNTETQEVDIYVAANKLVFPWSCNSMFYDFSTVEQIDFSAFDSNIDTRNVTDMRDMFGNCIQLTLLDVSFFDTSNVSYMQFMFGRCRMLTDLYVSHFNTNKVRQMDSMFDGCSALTSLDVTNFDTSNVTNMRFMFSECSVLTTIDVTQFIISKVKSMGAMFYGCNVLTSIDLSNFDTGNVTDLSSMFSGCYALTSLDVTNFDTSNVTDFSAMFGWCHKLSALNLGSNFTITDGYDIRDMLYATPNGSDTPLCTITCTAATKDKHLDESTGINQSRIRWDIL